MELDFYTYSDLAKILKLSVKTITNYYSKSPELMPNRTILFKNKPIILKKDFQKWINKLK